MKDSRAQVQGERQRQRPTRPADGPRKDRPQGQQKHEIERKNVEAAWLVDEGHAAQQVFDGFGGESVEAVELEKRGRP